MFDGSWGQPLLVGESIVHEQPKSAPAPHLSQKRTSCTISAELRLPGLTQTGGSALGPALGCPAPALMELETAGDTGEGGRGRNLWTDGGTTRPTSPPSLPTDWSMVTTVSDHIGQS